MRRRCPPHRRPRADRRRGRRRAARASVRSGRAWTRFARAGLEDAAARRGRRRVGRSSGSASACRCCSRQRGGSGDAAGLGVIPGTVRWIPAGPKRPADAVEPAGPDPPDDPMFAGLGDDAVGVLRALAARRARRSRRSSPRRVEYGGDVNAAFRSGNVFATQFHPEKSSRPRPAGCSTQLRATSVGERGRMIELYPAIDLRGGRVVRLRTGDYDDQTVYGDDPVAVARVVRRRRRDVDPRRRSRCRQVGRPGQPTGRRGDRGRGGIECEGADRWRSAHAGRRRRSSPTPGVARVVMGSAAVRDPSSSPMPSRARARRRRARPP